MTNEEKQQNCKLVFPKFLYARTLDNKTIDVSYAPQSMEAIEYVRNDIVEQEQKEIDLEKEIARYTMEACLLPITHKRTPMDIMESDWINCAHHFYELGLKARKEK